MKTFAEIFRPETEMNFGGEGGDQSPHCMLAL